MRDIVIEHPLRKRCTVSPLCILSVAKWRDRRLAIAEPMNGLFDAVFKEEVRPSWWDDPPNRSKQLRDGSV